MRIARAKAPADAGTRSSPHVNSTKRTRAVQPCGSLRDHLYEFRAGLNAPDLSGLVRSGLATR